MFTLVSSAFLLNPGPPPPSLHFTLIVSLHTYAPLYIYIYRIFIYVL